MSSKPALSGLEPASLWDCFSQITEIPRPSGQEAGIAEWITRWADRLGFACRRDAAGNLCVYVPASSGLTSSRTVALQAHLDMVCVRLENTASDPAAGHIEVRREADWIVAPHSTLGADNGIGIAAALCLAESTGLPHGPLELLFTVEEETTFKGADELDPSLLHADVMLNLDSESMQELYIGCAGAIWTRLRWPAPSQPLPEGWPASEISLSGLTGGHSGMDIHKNRLNAIQGMVRLLRSLSRHLPFQLCALEGGDAFNAIPIWSRARISFPPDLADSFEAALADARARLASRYSLTDPGLSLSMTRSALQGLQCWSDESRDRLLDLLSALPSGVLAMEQQASDIVETSSNLGLVALKDGALEIHSLSRSTVAEAQEETAASIESAARLAGADFAIIPPVTGPWRLRSDSALLSIVKAAYQDLFHREPAVVTAHGVVECGTIQERLPRLEALSLGPEIQNPHRPGERVHIPSVAEFYSLLCEVLRRLAA